MKEIIFIVQEAEEGGYTAHALGESIFTEAESIPQLREMIKDAIHCHYDNAEDMPKIAHLHFTKEEVLAL